MIRKASLEGGRASGRGAHRTPLYLADAAACAPISPAARQEASTMHLSCNPLAPIPISTCDFQNGVQVFLLEGVVEGYGLAEQLGTELLVAEARARAPGKVVGAGRKHALRDTHNLKRDPCPRTRTHTLLRTGPWPRAPLAGRRRP